MPRASFITTFYNNEKTLNEAILSLLGQSLQDIEVIAIDDASTDNSLRALKEIDDDRVVIISGEKLGRVGALNKGLSLAKAEYVGILDADDIALTHRAEIQVDFLEQNPDISLIFSNVELINEDGAHIGKTHFPLSIESTVNTLLDLNPFAHSSVMFRKDHILQMGGYNPRLKRSVDYNLYLELMLNGRKLKGINECVSKLRVSKSSWGKVDGAAIQFFYGTLGLFNYFQYQKTKKHLLRAKESEYEHYLKEFEKWYNDKGISDLVRARNEISHAKQALKLGEYFQFLNTSISVLKKFPFFWELKRTPITYPYDCERFFKEYSC